MEDHFAGMNAAEVRREYWGEDSNDFFDALVKTKRVKKPKSIFGQPKKTAATRKLTKASRELRFDHYGLAAQWTLDDRTMHLPTYFVGQKIELDIGFPDSAFSGVASVGNSLLVEVLQLLGQPWKSGCVILVRCIESPQRQDVDHKFVLKIIDSRFCLPIHGKGTAIHALQRFVDMLICGTAADFSKLLHADPTTEFPPRSWLNALSNWQKLVALSHHGHVMAKKEASAYRHLQQLQGYHIPKLWYEVCTRPWFKAPPSVSHLVKSSGLLIEYIEGDTLATIQSVSATPCHQRSFCLQLHEKLIRASNIFEYYGFEHESLAARNILIRKQPKEDGSRIVFIDFYRHKLRKAEEGYGKYLGYWTAERMLYESASVYMYPTHERVRALWNNYLFTGRMEQENLLPAQHLLDDRAATSSVIAKIQYRVIMDDIWHLDHRPILDEDLKRKALISRVVYRIIKADLRTTNSSGDERENWCLRALPRIANQLGYETDGLLERFERSYEVYIMRPNTPKLPQVLTTASNASEVCHLAQSPNSRDDVASSIDTSNSSHCSSSVSLTSSRTSIDSLDAPFDGKLCKPTSKIFIQKENSSPDYNVLEAELKVLLELK